MSTVRDESVSVKPNALPPNGQPTHPSNDISPGDRVASEAIRRAIHKKRIARKTREGIAGLWSDLLGFIEQSTGVSTAEGREAKVEQWLENTQPRYPVEIGLMRRALTLAELKFDVEPLDDESDGPPLRRSFRKSVLGISAFNNTQYELRWRIERIFVADQPAIVGAPKKSMKTTLMADLVVSVAGCLPFLGVFVVPEPAPVLLLSGESGGFVIQETIRRICRAKDISPEDLEGNLFIGDELPQLGLDEDLRELTEFIREFGIKVVVVDPLYLCLLTGAPGRRLDPSNLFDVGPLLLAISRACRDAGATPVLVHHFKKNGADPHDLPELEELAYAGIQEFARQWILLKRRERYEPGSGQHKLWMSVGGSAGHSGEWAVDIDEGVLGDDFQGRRWEVEVKLASEARSQTAEQRQAAKVAKEAEKTKVKDEAKEIQHHADTETALDALRRHGKPATKTEWQEEILGWGRPKFGPAFGRLRESCRIQPAKATVANRNGQREVDGWEPSAPTGEPAWFDAKEGDR